MGEKACAALTISNRPGDRRGRFPAVGGKRQENGDGDGRAPTRPETRERRRRRRRRRYTFGARTIVVTSSACQTAATDGDGGY